MSGHVSVPAAARAAALPSLAAGMLWVAAWVHLLVAHGTGVVNERRLAFGMTWLDSGRLVAPALLLAAVSVWILVRESRDQLLRVAGFIAIAGLAVMAVGAGSGFWTQPIGTYVGASRTAGIAATGGLLAMIGSVIAAVGLMLVGLAAGRARTVPRWTAALIGIAGISTVPWLHESPQGVAFGLAWLGVGTVLAWPERVDAGLFGRLAGVMAIGSGLAYVAYPFTNDTAITAWNLLIVPAALWLGVRTAPRDRGLAVASAAAGVAASVLWALASHEPQLEVWWIGLAAAWWLSLGWLLRTDRPRLAAFTMLLGVATVVDFVVTSLDAAGPFMALGGFKIPLAVVWTLWVGWTLVREPLLERT